MFIVFFSNSLDSAACHCETQGGRERRTKTGLLTQPADEAAEVAAVGSQRRQVLQEVNAPGGGWQANATKRPHH